MATAIRSFETTLAALFGAAAMIGSTYPAVGAVAIPNQTVSSQTFVASHPVSPSPTRPPISPPVQSQPSGTQISVGVTPPPPSNPPPSQVVQSPVGSTGSPTPAASPAPQPAAQPGSGSSNSGQPVANAGPGASPMASGVSSNGETFAANTTTTLPGTIRGPSEETGGASPDTSRGANGATACAAPDRAASCRPGEAPEYIVTATVAQAGDVSAGTYVFGTNADGSPRVMQATPVTPGTLGAAGLDRLVGRGSASQPMVTGALSEVASAGGAKTMAVDLSGDKLLSFAVGNDSVGHITDGSGKALAQGTEIAAEQPVVMVAAVAEHVVQSAINLEGVHPANGYLIRDGKLVLVYLEPGQHLAEAPQSVAAATPIAAPAN